MLTGTASPEKYNKPPSRKKHRPKKERELAPLRTPNASGVLFAGKIGYTGYSRTAEKLRRKTFILLKQIRNFGCLCLTFSAHAASRSSSQINCLSDGVLHIGRIMQFH